MLEIVFVGLCTCFFVNTCKQNVSCLEKFLNQALGFGSLAQVFTENLQLPANCISLSFIPITQMRTQGQRGKIILQRSGVVKEKKPWEYRHLQELVQFPSFNGCAP